MKGLLYKEFLMMKPHLIFIGVVQLVASIFMIVMALLKNDPMFINMVCYFLMIYLLSILDSDAVAHDEKRSWIIFVSSTPDTMVGQIRCKYYFSLILNLILLFWNYYIDMVTMAICGDPTASACQVFLVLFCIFILYKAILLPFNIRFGTKSGSAVMGISTMALLTIAGLYFLFGDISFLYKGNFEEFIMNFFNNNGVLWIIAILPYVAAAGYYLSYKISTKIYRKGVENYGE